MELQGLKNTLNYVQGIKDMNKSRIDSMREYLKETDKNDANEYVLVEIAKASAIVRNMEYVLVQISAQISEILEQQRILLDLERDTNESFLSSIGGKF
ncbi:hypothetical protein [Romboutsia timonensis]|uniref:hypothetical protein n=1 Tax=Romboutsia timonensis TaxID=1776391 RepID=UPI002A82533E|nr:hypothetical protein [Romboutsia timonensis]MDY3960967.1 hypothetical protein [Romboutsia timonensis]